MAKRPTPSQPETDASASSAEPVKARPSARVRKHNKALFLGVLIVMIAGAAVAVTLASQRSAVPVAANTLQTYEFTGGTAKITNDLGSTCSTGAFDNKTGRITHSDEPCETVSRDANGVPIPVGTMHRLDSISKAFSGR
jgi:hypothetical protein